MSYSPSSKFLHRLMFKNPGIVKALFEFDIDFFGAGDDNAWPEKPVFITGLARAGTTSILRRLHKTGRFRSLTYGDMPFVLSPGLWRRIRGKRDKNEVEVERAHGDGIMVNSFSPEAFEEVFWLHFAGEDFVRDQYLRPHQPTEEVMDSFKSYLKAVIRTRPEPWQTRYLSKNNNAILRLPHLLEAFPGGAFIMPFRDPVGHAASLFNQHHHFLEVNQADAFSADYMKWLGHFEFGQYHKPFYLAEDLQPPTELDPLEINYWLTIWYNFYAYAAREFAERVTFFSFRTLCENPEKSYDVLSELVGVGIEAPEEAFAPPQREPEGVDRALLAKCEALYDRLLELAANQP